MGVAGNCEGQKMEPFIVDTKGNTTMGKTDTGGVTPLEGRQKLGRPKAESEAKE